MKSTKIVVKVLRYIRMRPTYNLNTLTPNLVRCVKNGDVSNGKNIPKINVWWIIYTEDGENRPLFFDVRREEPFTWIWRCVRSCLLDNNVTLSILMFCCIFFSILSFFLILCPSQLSLFLSQVEVIYISFLKLNIWSKSMLRGFNHRLKTWNKIFMHTSLESQLYLTRTMSRIQICILALKDLIRLKVLLDSS